MGFRSFPALENICATFEFKIWATRAPGSDGNVYTCLSLSKGASPMDMARVMHTCKGWGAEQAG